MENFWAYNCQHLTLMYAHRIPCYLRYKTQASKSSGIWLVLMLQISQEDFTNVSDIAQLLMLKSNMALARRPMDLPSSHMFSPSNEVRSFIWRSFMASSRVCLLAAFWEIVTWRTRDSTMKAGSRLANWAPRSNRRLALQSLNSQVKNTEGWRRLTASSDYYYNLGC